MPTGLDPTKVTEYNRTSKTFFNAMDHQYELASITRVPTKAQRHHDAGDKLYWKLRSLDKNDEEKCKFAREIIEAMSTH